MTPATRVLALDTVLLSGAHPSAEAGMCVMEAVAYVAGERHSDHPTCACPVVSDFLRAWNDALPDDDTRTRLLTPLIPKLIDSKSTRAVERKRSWLAFDWLIREQAPAWLALVESLREHEAALRGLLPVISSSRVQVSSAAIFAARDASAAARDAAWAAARDAAWAAARDAARDAAWAAARDAAWAAARDAAWAAATNRLAPIVASLQPSALLLVERMLAVTPETTDEQLDALCDWSRR
jgi:hypothetical protein